MPVTTRSMTRRGASASPARAILLVDPSETSSGSTDPTYAPSGTPSTTDDDESTPTVDSSVASSPPAGDDPGSAGRPASRAMTRSPPPSSVTLGTETRSADSPSTSLGGFVVRDDVQLLSDAESTTRDQPRPCRRRRCLARR